MVVRLHAAVKALDAMEKQDNGGDDYIDDTVEPADDPADIP
jgi:hypothetical protein